jgi:hypothetical protein
LEATRVLKGVPGRETHSEDSGRVTGTVVERTLTPGAASSTWLFRVEKGATVALQSTAATEMTAS